MNKQMFILALLLSSLTSFSQIAYIDTLNNIIKDTTGDARLKYVLSNEFSRIAKTNAHGSIGNYVGISTNDNNLSFAYSFVRKSDVFELNASAGLVEGVSTLVSNSELNTGVSIGFKYNRIFGSDSIAINYNEVDDIINADKKLMDEYNLAMLKHQSSLESLQKDVADKQKAYDEVIKKLKILDDGKGKPYLDAEKADNYKKRHLILESEKSLLEHQLENVKPIMHDQISLLKERRDDESNRSAFKYQQFIIDSLKVTELPQQLSEKIKAKKKEIIGLEKLIKVNTYQQSVYDKLLEKEKIAKYELKVAKEKVEYFNENGSFIIMEHHNSYVAAHRKNLERINKIRPTDIKLTWITVGGSVTNENFSLFDPSLSIEDQIYKENDIVPSASFSFTYYVNKDDETSLKVGARQIRYFTIGGSVKYGNNLSSLSQVEVQTTDSISGNRSIIKTQKAYMGDFKNNTLSAKFFTDYYEFFGYKDNVGLHLRGTLDIGPQAPVTSVRFGLLFAATKADDYKSVVNFELFYGLNDIFKSNKEDGLLSRNIWGIQATFPFDIKTQ